MTFFFFLIFVFISDFLKRFIITNEVKYNKTIFYNKYTTFNIKHMRFKIALFII